MMGRKKKQQPESGQPELKQSGQESSKLKQPEPFPAELLQQSKGARIEYFETQCLIEHTELQEACNAVLRAVCMPKDDSIHRGRGTMVLVIGPPRVGKTTLIHFLEKELYRRTEDLMRRHPGYIPFVSVTTDIDVGSKASFDWMDFYPAVLRELKDPFLQQNKKYALRARDIKEAMVEGLLQRKTGIVIIDEAHHLAKARSGRRLWDNLDHLKYIENRTGVSHVLVGTYAMRPFRKVNAQLALRSVDVHFRRYDATKDEDRIAFKSALWALQRQLPLEEEPQLRQHWEFLYARSLGCIGLLKQHLNLALKWALDDEQAKTITLDHLQRTAPHTDKVSLALRDIIRGEKDLAEPVGADDDLLKELKLIAPKAPEKKKDNEGKKEGVEKKNDSSSKGQGQVSFDAHRGQKLRPFERSPGRDSIGPKDDEQEYESDDDLIESEDGGDLIELEDESQEEENEGDDESAEIAG
jgi:GTPase SAR1 family protein